MPSREIHPTKHALEKMALRNITWGDIVDVTEKPDVVFGPDNKGRTVLQKDDLCVVLARDGAVVTVLLRSVEDWTDLDARNRDA